MCRSVAFGLALLCTLPAQALAQSATSISAGATLVYDAASVQTGRGFHIQAGEEFGHWTNHLRFRIDGFFSRNPSNAVSNPHIERAYALTTAAVLRAPGQKMLRPYSVVGIGLYGFDTYTSFNPGINAGVGLELARGEHGIYAEARVHRFWRDARESPREGRDLTLLPLSFGIRF